MITAETPTRRHNSRMAKRLALVAAVTLLGSACTSHYLPEPATVQEAVDCSTAVGWNSNPSDPAQLRKGHVPDGFDPVDVVRCTWSLPAVPSGATTAPDPVITTDHLSGNYTALLAALAEPSDRAQNVSCLDYAEVLPEVWLVNAAGQAVNVQWPLDGCDHSKPDTAQALAELTVTQSSTSTVKGPRS